jgi:hypothetical protein
MPVPAGQQAGQETDVLEVAVRLGALLPVGWRAELECGSVTLSWRAG